MKKDKVMSMMNYLVDGDLNIKELNARTSISDNYSIETSCWNYWQEYYYPQVIRESYPIYIQERAMDKGKQAFEVIKMLKDKKFIQLEKVADFIDCMDALIKVL